MSRLEVQQVLGGVAAVVSRRPFQHLVPLKPGESETQVGLGHRSSAL